MMMTEVWGTTMKLAIGTERENTTSDCVAFFMIWLLSTHSYSHSLRSRVRDTYIYYIYTEVMKCHSTKMFLSLDKRVHKEYQNLAKVHCSQSSINRTGSCISKCTSLANKHSYGNYLNFVWNHRANFPPWTRMDRDTYAEKKNAVIVFSQRILFHVDIWMWCHFLEKPGDFISNQLFELWLVNAHSQRFFVLDVCFLSNKFPQKKCTCKRAWIQAWIMPCELCAKQTPQNQNNDKRNIYTT